MNHRPLCSLWWCWWCCWWCWRLEIASSRTEIARRVGLEWSGWGLGTGDAIVHGEWLCFGVEQVLRWKPMNVQHGTPGDSKQRQIATRRRKRRTLRRSTCGIVLWKIVSCVKFVFFKLRSSASQWMIGVLFPFSTNVQRPVAEGNASFSVKFPWVNGPASSYKHGGFSHWPEWPEPWKTANYKHFFWSKQP